MATNETAMVKYGKTDLSHMKDEREGLKKEREASKGRANFMKLVEGRNVLRILPPRGGLRNPFFKTFIHYLRNPAQPSKPGRPVVCPSKTRNAPCLICAKVSQLRRTGLDADQRAAADLSASRRIYANVVNLQDPDKGVLVMEFGTKIYEELLGYIGPTDPKDPDFSEDHLGDITDPDTGYSFVIERTGTKKEDTRYTLRPAKQPSPLAKKSWLNELHDLTAMAQSMDDENIRAIMEGRAPEDEGAASEEAGTTKHTEVSDDLFDQPIGKK